MSLRVHRASPAAAVTTSAVAPSGSPDGWASRLAKLIPAEAIGLYSAGANLIPKTAGVSLELWAAISLLICVWFRYLATKGTAGRTQWIAVAIAGASFVIWLVTVGRPSPIGLPSDMAYWGTLIAMLWGVIIPSVYKGDA